MRKDDDRILIVLINCAYKGLFTRNVKIVANIRCNDSFESKQLISYGIFTPSAIICGVKK